MKIGDRIKHIRKLLKLSQAEFAKKTNVSPSLVSFVEKGIKTPSFEMISLLLSSFSVNINWVLSGEGEPFINHNAKDLDGEALETLRNLFHGLPDEEKIVDFLTDLEVPVLYHSWMSWYIKTRSDLKPYIEQYFSDKSREESD